MRLAKEKLDSCRYVLSRNGDGLERIVMIFGLRRSAVIIFGLLVLMNFNNCGVYETENSDLTSSSLDCSSDSSCVETTNLNLKIQPLPKGEAFPLTASLQAFNIGGTCNEAGFTNHQITWALKLNGTSVRTSDMTIHGKTWNSTCVNGKFRIYVNLTSISEDAVDRTGGLYGSGTNRASYDLSLEIMGQDSSGVWYRNTSQGGVKTVTLTPL